MATDIDRRTDFEASLTRRRRPTEEAGAALQRASLLARRPLPLQPEPRRPSSPAVAFVVMVGFVYITPWVDHASAYDIDLAKQYQPTLVGAPVRHRRFGRDLLVRTALGGRVSVQIGFVATFAIMFVGIMYGAISGFAGGWVDNAMMRFLDALYGLPYLPFAIITLAIFGVVNFWTMVVALTSPPGSPQRG